MQKIGGVLSISTKEEFKYVWEKLINNQKICLEIGKTNFDFVRKGLGSSTKIISYINQYLD